MSPRALEWGLSTEEKGGWKSRWTEAVWTACIRCNCWGAGSVKLDPLENSLWVVTPVKGYLELKDVLNCFCAACSLMEQLYLFILLLIHSSVPFSFLPALPSPAVPSPCGFGSATALSSCGFSIVTKWTCQPCSIPLCLLVWWRAFNQLKVSKDVQLALIQKGRTFH